MPDPLKDYADAAAWLGVPRRWLEDEVRAGRAPHTKLGKHVRFSQAHLDALVAAGERKPVTAAAAPPTPTALTLTKPSVRARRAKA